MAIAETFTAVEKEYGFDAVQVILLLELANAENLYTYPLAEEKDISDEQFIFAAQDLLTRQFIEYSSGDGLCAFGLTEKARDLLGPMFQPERVLEVVSAWEGTVPALIYMGHGSRCTVTQWHNESGYIGISCLDTREIAGWLADAGFLPTQPFATVREAETVQRYDAQMRLNRDRIRTNLVVHPGEPPALWAMQENVRSAVKVFDVTPKKAYGDRLYVFLETETESWILSDLSPDFDPGETGNVEENFKMQDAQWSLEPDSIEYRNNLWRDLI